MHAGLKKMNADKTKLIQNPYPRKSALIREIRV